MSFKNFLLGLLLLLAASNQAQEVLVGLQLNEAVYSEAQRLQQSEKNCFCKSAETEVSLNLPFFDDFSVDKVYPNADLWQGRSVYVNKDFPFFPPNVGGATFDAIDSLGLVYDDAVWFPPFIADRLTSRPLRLDSLLSIQRALSPADSLYLSFYYQPQGVGDEPEPWDTLVLEFGVPSGDSIFARMDSIRVIADLLMVPGQDTLQMFDTLWAPVALGCNPLVFMVNYDPLPILRGDSVTVLCDSVYVPITNWKKMWWSEGMRLSEFQELYGKDFVQVMVPVLDSVWFNQAFQFRFYNYASIADDIIPTWKSNVDQWNVDYIYLNYNRSAGDSTYRSLTFSKGAPSFLRDYKVMPYRQYRADPTNSVRQQFDMYIANLDNIEHNTSYEYRVQQVEGDYEYRYNGGSCNLGPFYEDGFQTCEGCGTSHACPPVQALFNIDYGIDTTSYIIKHFISDSSDQNPIVDSAIYHQGFYNYYAYDDGTPELGYGLVPAGAQLAYQFNVSLPDTLQGIQMLFNRTMNAANELYFNLRVWNDNNGQPGELIYEQENQKVAWSDKLYHFIPYMLDETLVVSGTFYVGWEQYTDDNLNLGFDSNNDEHMRIFYNSIDTWYNSSFEGALLMRPIVGSNLVLATNLYPTDNKPSSIKVYPNPAATHFSIEPTKGLNLGSANVELFNLLGSRVFSQKGIASQINIQSVPAGLYIVKVQGEQKVYLSKLLINR